MPATNQGKDYVRWPLITQIENRDDFINKDEKLVNAYMEKVDQGEYAVLQRPGTQFFSAPGAGVGRGLVMWQGNVYSIFGTNFYKNTTLIGTVDGTNGIYHFTSCLGATPKLFFMNGVAAYTYDGTNGLVQVTNVNYPSSAVKGCAFLDGTIYVMNSSATIFGSNINDPQTWTANNTIVAQIEPDNGIGIAKQLNYVVAFKQWSTEIFYDAANAVGSPLAPVQAAKLHLGCAHADTIQEIDGVLIWLATNRNGSVCVLKLEQLKPTIVSTPAIEKFLEEMTWSGVDNIYSFTFKTGGHRFYGITNTVSNLTFVYDLKDNMWYQWTDTAGNFFPFITSAMSPTAGTEFALVQHVSIGNIYQIDNTFIGDAGSPFTIDIVTPLVDFGTNRRKMISAMEFVGDLNGGLLQVRVSDDDYKTWSNFRTVDLNQIRPRLQNCGTFFRRAIHLRYAAAHAFRLRFIEIQMQPGVI